MTSAVYMSTLESANAAMLFMDGKVIGSYTIQITKMIYIDVGCSISCLLFS